MNFKKEGRKEKRRKAGREGRREEGRKGRKGREGRIREETEIPLKEDTCLLSTFTRSDCKLPDAVRDHSSPENIQPIFPL